MNLVACFVENKPGQTARVSSRDARVNICWVTIAHSGSFGVMKFLVRQAVRSLQEKGSDGVPARSPHPPGAQPAPGSLQALPVWPKAASTSPNGSSPATAPSSSSKPTTWPRPARCSNNNTCTSLHRRKSPASNPQMLANATLAAPRYASSVRRQSVGGVGDRSEAKAELVHFHPPGRIIPTSWKFMGDSFRRKRLDPARPRGPRGA